MRHRLDASKFVKCCAKASITGLALSAGLVIGFAGNGNPAVSKTERTSIMSTLCGIAIERSAHRIIHTSPEVVCIKSSICREADLRPSLEVSKKDSRLLYLLWCAGTLEGLPSSYADR